MKLRKFVEAGGQLITTDWALKHVVEVAFPGMVRFSGYSTDDEVVAVQIVDKEDEILKGWQCIRPHKLNSLLSITTRMLF